MKTKQKSDGTPMVTGTKSWRDTVGSLSHLKANYDGDIDSAIDQAITEEMLEQETRSLGRPPTKFSRKELSGRLAESTARALDSKSRSSQ